MVVALGVDATAAAFGLKLRLASERTARQGRSVCNFNPPWRIYIVDVLIAGGILGFAWERCSEEKGRSWGFVIGRGRHKPRRIQIVTAHQCQCSSAYICISPLPTVLQPHVHLDMLRLAAR